MQEKQPDYKPDYKHHFCTFFNCRKNFAALYYGLTPTSDYSIKLSAVSFHPVDEMQNEGAGW